MKHHYIVWLSSHSKFKTLSTSPYNAKLIAWNDIKDQLQVRLGKQVPIYETRYCRQKLGGVKWVFYSTEETLYHAMPLSI